MMNSISKFLIVTWTAGLLCSVHSRVNAQDAGERVSEVDSAIVILDALRKQELQVAWDALGARLDEPVDASDLSEGALPSALGGLYRSLVQQREDEQYELLEAWTMPSGQREHIRIIASPVPADAPPKVFARSIGMRPRDTTFAVASVGQMQGFFCTGWRLVQLADELGRLTRLKTQLEGMVDADVDGARELMLFAQLVGTRGQRDAVLEYLNEVRTLEASFSADSLVQVAIALAASQHGELQDAARECLAITVDQCSEGPARELRAFLREAHAIAVQLQYGDSEPAEFLHSKLEYWIPASARSATEIASGKRRPIWLTHEEHILHLSGGTRDALLFKLPLRGDFDFVCETQEGGQMGTDGGLVFGGLQFLALGRRDLLQVWDADASHEVTRRSPFARFDSNPVFNRVSVRSRKDSPQFESNFHPVWTETKAAHASPWVGLLSSGDNRPVFRNLSLLGAPTIPRSIALVSDSSLRGWQAGFFGETRPGFETLADEEAQQFDWTAEDGKIIGAANENADAPGLLQYQRPLLESETISYEFYCRDAESVQMHPSLGRIAFLLEPGGVRVRWITTGRSEWTSLPADNAALEPLNRRGPRPIPLKPEAWNSVQLTLRNAKLSLFLNEQLIYQRAMENEREQFGFYRARRSVADEIRNVELAGEWPQQINEEMRGGLLSVRD